MPRQVACVDESRSNVVPLPSRESTIARSNQQRFPERGHSVPSVFHRGRSLCFRAAEHPSGTRAWTRRAAEESSLLPHHLRECDAAVVEAGLRQHRILHLLVQVHTKSFWWMTVHLGIRYDMGIILSEWQYSMPGLAWRAPRRRRPGCRGGCVGVVGAATTTTGGMGNRSRGGRGRRVTPRMPRGDRRRSVLPSVAAVVHARHVR